MKRTIALLLISIFFSQLAVSQNNCVSNNKIELKPSVCSGYAGLLEGSLPSGGRGSYSYIWQKNDNDCGENGFVDIAGATGLHYRIPIPGTGDANTKVCYRRIVISGNCRDESQKIVVHLKDKPDIIVVKPTVTVQPTCTAIKGTVEVSGPTGGGFEYSLDGGAYQPATTFTGVSVGSHLITFRNSADPTCISQPVSVTLNEPPKPTGSITPAQAVLCPGGTQVLTATGGTSYQWHKDGVAIQGATTSTYTAAQAGTYSVTLITGSCSAPASNTAAVSQAPVPSGPITPAQAILCSGGSQVLTASGGASYQWYRDGAAIQGATSATYTATQGGTYSADIISPEGCKGKTANSAAVTVSAAITFTATPADVPCTASTGFIAVTNPAGGSGSGYSYSKDGGATFQPESTFKDLAPGTYSIVVKDAAGCKSAAATVAVKQAASTLSATVATVDIGCTQSSGAAAITATGGTAPYSYSLDGRAFGAAAAFTNLTAGPHKVVVKDAGGCTHEVSFTIRQSSTPPHLVITHPPPLCAGSFINLTTGSITTGSDTGLTYSYWRDTTTTATLNNPRAVGAGTYYIKATNRGGCFAVKPVRITSSTTPAGTITPANPATTCSGEALTLTASSGTSYQWYRNDSLLSDATAATYKATMGGTYTVVIHSSTCSGRAANVVVVRFQSCSPVTGTRVFVPTAFTPDGNSANDVLQPYFTGVRELMYFKVFNRWGQEVFRTSSTGKGWDGRLKGVPQPAETYNWMLECIDFNDKRIKQSGRSLLIR